MTPGTNFESMLFNPYSIKEYFVDNDHDPDVNFCHGVSMLDTQYLMQKQILRIFLKTLFPSDI